jgi:CheY-like chemotaxis protein
VEISVSDNGVGMPDGILEKIFDPFFTTKERGKGTGLGLSVVYNIVKNHNGSVTVESVQGSGTTFRILLPAVETESLTGGLAEPVSLKSVRNELILLVDDEELMQELGKELLEEAGYRVLIATNGQQAIDTYRGAWKDVSMVILDFIMPDKNGAQVFEELKAINPQLKMFFCTGYAEDEMIASLLEQHHVRALEKPFKPTKLLRMIKDVLDPGFN